MAKQRIGIAINAQHLHAEDQQLYHGVRAFSEAQPDFQCVLAPFAAEDLLACKKTKPPYHGVLAQATPELVDAAARWGVPVVDVWRDSSVRVPINCVFPDFAHAGRIVAEHLSSRGFDSFGFVINRSAQSQAEMCDPALLPPTEQHPDHDATGFAGWLDARGLNCSRFIAPKAVDANAKLWRRWVTSIRQWLNEQPKPIGLFVPNDWLCRYIAETCGELGYKVPHDVGLVCADNEPNLCMLNEPSLSAIDLGYRQVGFQAAAMLQRLLADPKAAGHADRVIRYVEPRVLHPRRSTDATSVRDPLVAQAMRYILEHAHHGISVSDVASHVASTRRTLERRFRCVLDRTVMTEITRCRIERLKRKLIETDEPIKCLVHESGFKSSRVLYETFVRQEGQSPSAYRATRWAGSQPPDPPKQR